MKLIIQEYLMLMKESGELDSLLPDLLLSMSIVPISTPQIGVRQNGVDIAAVGIDPENNKKTLFLLVVKSGDVSRADWDNEAQSIRPSLNEVKDVYLSNNVKPEHKSIPKKIVLCSGGELKQEVQQNWIGYTKTNEKKGELEFDFWGGAELSSFIENYLFNENIVPKAFRSEFRKTLALLSDPDYDFRDYYSILEKMLVEQAYSSPQKGPNKKRLIKILRTVNLCQNIIFFWAESEGNIRPAIYCAERTVLNAWDIIRKNKLEGDAKILTEYYKLYKALINIYAKYCIKVQKHCFIKDGFLGNSNSYILECLTAFENLGFISISGLLFFQEALKIEDQSLYESSQNICDMLKGYIENHKTTYAPCYDSHIIEITTAIYLLTVFQQHKYVDNWIKELIQTIDFAYRGMKKHFPIQSSSFDNLVELNISEEIEAEKVFQSSTLIAILAQWCVALDFKETYLIIQEVATKNFPDCTPQIWYPDNDTENFLYNSEAAYESGNVEMPVDLSIPFEEMKKRVALVQERTVPMNEISAINNGFIFLPLIASRHFRTPVLPTYWQESIIKESPEQ